MNWIHLIVAAVVYMVIGMVWYSKALFSNMWIQASGKTDMQGGGAGYAITTAAALVQAWVLSYLIAMTGVTDWMGGAKLGFVVWLVLGAATLSNNTFEGKPRKLWVINAGYSLVVLVVVGALLAAWH